MKLQTEEEETVLTAAALTGILSTSTMAAYADESETGTEQKIKHKNEGEEHLLTVHKMYK